MLSTTRRHSLRGQGHVAADLALGEEAKDRFVLHRAHPVLYPAHLQVDHGLAHVLGSLGLAGVGHRRVPGGPGAIEERLHVGAREALLGAPEADGHDDRVGFGFQQLGRVGAAQALGLARDVGDEPGHDGPRRFGGLKAGRHRRRGLSGPRCPGARGCRG